jgi:hypothetical protein
MASLLKRGKTFYAQYYVVKRVSLGTGKQPPGLRETLCAPDARKSVRVGGVRRNCLAAAGAATGAGGDPGYASSSTEDDGRETGCALQVFDA